MNYRASQLISQLSNAKNLTQETKDTTTEILRETEETIQQPVEKQERKRFVPISIPPIVANTTGDLLYAGTFGWIYTSLIHPKQIIKVSKIGKQCENNKKEFKIAQFIKNHLPFVNTELSNMRSTCLFSSTILQDSVFIQENEMCYYNQKRVFPVQLTSSGKRRQPVVFNNLIQLLPGLSGDYQLRCTGKTAALNRWTEVYDEDLVKDIIDAINMNGEDYGFAIAFFHGFFLSLNIELNDVEFIVGSSTQNGTPRLFVLDFDKVNTPTNIPSILQYTNSTMIDFGCKNDTNKIAIERGNALAKLYTNFRIGSPCLTQSSNP